MKHLFIISVFWWVINRVCFIPESFNVAFCMGVGLGLGMIITDTVEKYLKKLNKP